MNNQVGILLRWREQAVVIVGHIRSTVLAEVEDCFIDISKFSKFSKLIWVLTRIIGVAKYKSFKDGSTSRTPQLLQETENFLIQGVQKERDKEVQKNGTKGWRWGRYKALNPAPSPYPSVDGSCAQRIWTSRTLARFRQKYWVAQGSKVAHSSKSKCQMCNLRDVKWKDYQNPDSSQPHPSITSWSICSVPMKYEGKFF